MNNTYRHELKYVCSASQIKHLFELLKNVLPQDEHNGVYHVKSLYFETSSNRFLEETLNGVAKRSKYRLRRYDQDIQNIKFESKSSLYSLKQKRFIWLNQEQVETILFSGNQNILPQSELLNEFYYLRKTEHLKPKIIIDYDRTAFIYKKLNIRITLDQNITASMNTDSFFDNLILGKKLLPNEAGILEIKFDEILPTYISRILSLEQLEQTPFSKYVTGCLIHNNLF